MTAKTFYPLDAKATGANHMKLQDGGSAPAATVIGTGWTVGTTAATAYSLMAAQVQRAAATFGAGALPGAAPNNTLGDCWRSENPLTGTFAAGTWTFDFWLFSYQCYGQDGRLRCRVWRSANATGAGATELTTSTLLGSAYTNPVFGIEQECQWTWATSTPLIFNNEYLFIQLAWEITGAASNASADVMLIVGTSGPITVSITTSDFSLWRSHPYHCQGHLFLHNPDTVFAAQVDAATMVEFPPGDGAGKGGRLAGTTIYQYIYYKDVTAGDIDNVQPEQTLWLGSAAGLYDKGRTRVRAVATAPGLAPGEKALHVWVSPNVTDGSLDLATDLYITVKDEYRPWMKPPYYPDSGEGRYDGTNSWGGTVYNQLPVANAGPGYAYEIDPVTELITITFNGSASFAAARRAVLGQYSADRCTGGTPSASSENGAHTADLAFDDNTSTYWESTGVGTQTLTYQFASPRTARRVTLRCSGTTAPQLIFMKASNNGSTWFDLGRAVTQTGWGSPETRTFYPDVYNDQAFTYFRFSFEDDNGGATYRVYEVTISEEDRVTTSPYTWDVGDGTITVGSATTESITVTFPAGFRYVSLTVTDTNGYTGVTHVPVFAAAAAEPEYISQFQSVSLDSGPRGQTLELIVYGTLNTSTCPDNALVMYWETEWYGDVKGSLPAAGPSGREHMKFIGWIHDEMRRLETDEFSTHLGQRLRCLDIGGWLAELPAFPLVLMRKTLATPGYIYECDGLNIDRFIYLIARWLSNAAEIADFTWSGTLHKYPVELLNAGGNSIYEQADGIAKHIGYLLTCNKVGQLQVKPDPCMLPTVDRTATVQTDLVIGDLISLEYAHRYSPAQHWVWASGVLQGTQDYDDPTFGVDTYFAVAPGETPGQGSGTLELGEQLVNSAAEVQTRGGLLYARENAPQEAFTADLAHVGDTGIDPAEMEWVTLTLSAANSPRGLAFAAERFLPLRLATTYDPEAMTKTVQLTMERETSGPDAVEYSP